MPPLIGMLIAASVAVPRVSRRLPQGSAEHLNWPTMHHRAG